MSGAGPVGAPDASRVVGSAMDISQRIRAVLPERWFADDAPVLDGLLAGLSSAWAGLHGLLAVVRRQSRLLTATDTFLDMAAADLFGVRVARRDGEPDADFRARIMKAMARPRVTRAAMLAAVADADAELVRLFEPGRATDTGVYGGPGLAWNAAGGWGSLAMPLQSLVTVRLSGADAETVRLAVADAVPVGGAAWLRFEE